MQTHVDDALHQVVFLYKLIEGVAESSHGTRKSLSLRISQSPADENMADVARMAGVPLDVVHRADQVSAEFFQAFKLKMASRRSSALPVVAHADFAWLMRLAMGDVEVVKGMVGDQMGIIRRAIGAYEGL
jgi:DNA mismatch repair protein MSH6